LKRALGEVLFEFRQVGSYLKVSAIDPVTNTEISIVATPGMDRSALKRMALRKLAFVIDKADGK
jgi:hypothetical protein